MIAKTIMIHLFLRALCLINRHKQYCKITYIKARYMHKIWQIFSLLVYSIIKWILSDRGDL